MDGHDGHTAGPGAAGRGVLPGGPRLRRRVDGTHQRRDAVGTRRRAEGGKLPGILPAAGTIFQNAQRRQIAGGGKNFFHQLFRRDTAGHLPQGGQPRIERPHLLHESIILFTVHRLQHRAVQAHAGGLSARFPGFFPGFFLVLAALGTQTHQVVIRKAEQRPQHDRRQIDVLRRVVDDLQQGNERPDVRGFHEVFPGIRIHRDAPGGQRFHIGWELRAGGKQDTAVLVLHRAGGRTVPHRFAALHQCFDAFRDPGRIRFGGVVRQELHLHAARVLARRTADQPLAIAVGRIAQLRGHELFEDKVDARHHLRGGPEVCVQRQQGVLPGSTLRRARAGRPAGQGRPAVQLFPEDAGVRLTEAVDALFQVPHQEEVVPCRGRQTAVKGILQGIGVLVFVHHDGGVIFPDVSAQRSGGTLRRAQQLQRQVLKVAEFQQLAFLFLGREPGIKIPHSGKQRPQTRQCRLPVGLSFLFAARDQFYDFFKQGQRLVGPGLDGGLVVAFQVLFHALQARHLLHAQHKGGEPVV